MRILHVVPSYLPAWRYGGPIRSVHGLARAQFRAGDEVEVFTTDADGPGRLDVPTDRPVEIDGVQVSYFRRGFPRRQYRSPAMGEALRRRIGEFDLAHLHSVFLWPTQVAARIAAAALVPYFVSPRGMLVESLIVRRGRLRKRLWIRLVERKSLSESAGIVLQSELERQELKRLGLQLAPTYVAPNGLDFEEIASERAQPVPREIVELIDGGPYVLFLGRLTWKKGLDRLIAAMGELPKARLLVGGNDEEGLRPGLERLARSCGAAERVHFLGEVRGAAKWALLEGAAVFCLPSISENFGIAALEALAAGSPVVISQTVGLSLPEGASTAVLQVASLEPKSLATAIRSLLDSNWGSGTKRPFGEELVGASFSWAVIADRLRDFYRQQLVVSSARLAQRVGHMSP